MKPFLPAAALCLLAVGCGFDGPEARIRDTFDQSVRAVEDGDASRAAAPLSPRFSGPEGLDAAGAKLALMGMLRGRKVGVTVLSQKVAVDGSKATQYVDVILTDRGSGILPQDGSRKSLVLQWERRDGDWRILELQME